MFKKSFFNRQSTAITALFTGETIQEIISKARTAEFDGADGIAVELCFLPPELRTVENFRHIMEEVRLPFMFVCYRNDQWLGGDDDARQECLLRAAEAGAEVIDVMGDLYAPSPFELTRNPEAVAKQQRLIEEIHARGAKALISSHLHNDPPQSTAAVLEILKTQQSHGADIAKIVTAINTEEDLLEAIKTTMTLNREMEIPFIHLGCGKFSRIHRFMATKLGVGITFGVPYYAPTSTYAQPTIKAFKNVIDNIPWDINNL